LEPLEIEHFTEDDFFERFRQDLIGCEERLLVLSPFMSLNRVEAIMPAFLAALARHVMVEVYSRPASGQPEMIRDHYERIRSRFELSGIRFCNRVNMHEKVATIDDRILWHGSLNILSHNDSRESMLRLESDEIVANVLEDLGLATNSKPSFAAESDGQYADSRQCPSCGARMFLYGESRMWICERSPACKTATFGDEPPKHVTERAAPPSLNLACPICGSAMISRLGLIPGIECSKDDCAFRLDPRLSGAVLRLFKRRTP
jgi:hypothetical protein